MNLQKDGGEDRRGSAVARATSRMLMIELNRKRHLIRRCSAKAKSTGEQCQQFAMANGKCRFHGGRTPKAAGWHRPRWPDGAAPDAVARADRKAVDLQKRARKQKRRLAQMTPEEQAAHKAWQAAHKPGSPAERARRRAERKDAADARRLLAGKGKPQRVNAEQQALLDAITAGEARLAELRHEAEMAENWTVGVFA